MRMQESTVSEINQRPAYQCCRRVYKCRRMIVDSAVDKKAGQVAFLISRALGNRESLFLMRPAEITSQLISSVDCEHFRFFVGIVRYFTDIGESSLAARNMA